MDLHSYTFLLRTVNAYWKRERSQHDNRERQVQPDTSPRQNHPTTQLRVALGTTLHRLADAIDPNPTGIPSHQH